MRRHFPAVFGGRTALSSEPRPARWTEEQDDETLVGLPVPDLVGLTSTEARRVARAARLGVTVEERPSSQGSWGTILEQDPTPGTLGAPDGIVILTVGTRARVPVPDVRGRDEDEALSILRDAGLGAARRAARKSDRVPEGCVVRTRPRAGAEVAAGSCISYVVAAGPHAAGQGAGRRVRRASRVARMADGSFLMPERGPERSRR
jgi:hypothetical protein